MKRNLPTLAIAVSFLVWATAGAFAQAVIGGAGGGGNLGDQIVDWVFQNFLHAMCSAALLCLLICGAIMRSHIGAFIAAGCCIIAVANYQAILARVGL